MELKISVLQAMAIMDEGQYPTGYEKLNFSKSELLGISRALRAGKFCFVDAK